MMRYGLLALTIALGACSLKVDTTGAQFACNDGDTCPDGSTCTDGQCPMPQAKSCAMALGAGVEHTCAVREDDGTVWCWGLNRLDQLGQLGENAAVDQLIPVQVQGTGLPKFTKVAGGGDHTCALDVGGVVWCWGNNDAGQLGNNTAASTQTPVQVVGLGGMATAIAAGDEHSCALVTGGKIACWGSNDAGQLGIASDSRVPVFPDSFGTVTAISAHGATTCAVTDANEMWCWGDNSSGQLGDNTNKSRAIPARAMIKDAVAAAVGRSFACGLTSAGAVFCAGNNDGGQLGSGRPSTGMPSQVALQSQAKAITAGDDFACALDNLGQVWCWGDDGNAELADGMTDTSHAFPGLSAYTSATEIAAGSNHLCVRSTTNAITCSGFNGHGELGHGVRTTQTTPKPIAGLTGVSSIWTSDDFTCATGSDGGVQCWGANFSGQLGDGSFLPRAQPAPVIGVVNATQVVTGNGHSCALIGDGTVQCWGAGFRGQLGDGDHGGHREPRPVAGPVPGLTGVKYIAANGDHTCAVTAMQVKCWGGNDLGGNGDGTENDSFTPVVVSGLPANVSGIAVGELHACARLPTNTVMCWGDNRVGQLGNNQAMDTQTNSAVPVAVSGITDVDQISARGGISCAHSTDGYFACWGYGGSGALGVGGFDNQIVPHKVTSMSVDIIAGDRHTCARSAAGALSCWGANDFGQLGDGTDDGRLTPASAILGLSNTLLYALADRHTCAVSSTDKSVSCWGDDREGQLGDGVMASLMPSAVQLPCP